MADRIRAFNWAATPLGPIEGWSDVLLSSVNSMLAIQFGVLLLWGPDMLQFYNDAAIPLLTERHPRDLGVRAEISWAEAWQIIGPQLHSVLSNGESIYQQNVNVPVLRNGKLEDVYWRYSYSPVYEADGTIVGITVISQDNTREVRAERELRESEALSSRILQSIGDAVIVTDDFTRVLRMNPVAEKLTGWKIAEAKDEPLSSVFRIVNESTREVLESPSEIAKRTGQVVGLANHTILLSKDGAENNIDDSGAPIRNEQGELVGTVLVFRNINERRQAERQRNALTEQLNQVLNATTDAVVLLNRDWMITYANPIAENLYAASGPILGTNVWERFPSAVFDGSPYTEHFYRAMNEGISGQFEAFYPEPLDRWLDIMVHPTRDGVVSFSRDITEQKRAEGVLIKNEKFAAAGKLAASIAHEINNPLAAVTNLLYLARFTEDPGQVKMFLETAEQELQRVSVITNQTLRFYKQSPVATLVAAEDLVSSVLAIQKGRITEGKIVVEQRHTPSRLVLCLEGEIRQVLNNLIGNAIEAMTPKGGRLLVRSREGTDWNSGRHGILITVADAGGGIPPQNLKSIFEPFFTTKGLQGNGLGLYVSRCIVDNHEGVLDVRSSQRPGRTGTTFNLFLPYDRPDTADQSK